jgi:hypothetical protein
MGYSGQNEKYAAQVKDHVAERLADEEARVLVDAWNERRLAAGKAPLFSPTIESAIRAKTYWMRIQCDGCNQEYDIDLRRIVV